MQKDGWAGIDVSAARLVAAIEDARGRVQRMEVGNDAAGHRTLVRHLQKAGAPMRVCLEATGVYHFDLAVALHRAPGVAVMVANPRSTAHYARAVMRRSKTDRVDAVLLLDFGKRMPFRAWTPPSATVLNVRAFARRIEALIQTRAQEKQRLHAITRSAEFSPALAAASRAHLSFLRTSIRALTAEAKTLVEAEPSLARRFAQLVSIPGIGERSALRLLGELAVLPADMTVRQWVAHSGLDPRHLESGSSIHRPPRISRAGNAHLRHALYMPALVAVRVDAAVRRFYVTLIGRQKRPKQALVAIMRKLLHAIYGMFLHDELYNATKCYPQAA
jgi:transposase